MNIINYVVQDQDVVSENFLCKISTLTLFNTNCRRQETQSLELECLTLVSLLSTVITLPVSDGLLQHFVRQVVSG